MLFHHINPASSASLLWLCIVSSSSSPGHAIHLRFLSDLILVGFFCYIFFFLHLVFFSPPLYFCISSSISVLFCVCLFFSLSFRLPPSALSPGFSLCTSFPDSSFLSPWFPFSHLHWNVGRNIFSLKTKRLTK